MWKAYEATVFNGGASGRNPKKHACVPSTQVLPETWALLSSCEYSTLVPLRLFLYCALVCVCNLVPLEIPVFAMSCLVNCSMH